MSLISLDGLGFGPRPTSKRKVCSWVDISNSEFP